MAHLSIRLLSLLYLTLLLSGCGLGKPENYVSLVLAGGSGPEEEFALKQLASFQELHPEIKVTYQATPSSASERHTLYVTWLSSQSPDIDILNLDVIWVAEFAAAGWLQPLDGWMHPYAPALEDFLPGGLATSRYRGHLYSLPWFADAGLLYYRRDLYQAAGFAPPHTFADLFKGLYLKEKFHLPYGFVFPGQAYEGLVTVVLEFFWGKGGRVFDEKGNPVLNSPQNRAALQLLVDLIYSARASPLAVTTFQEEDCRHAFEQGYAVLMRNWPYAYALMNQPGCPVQGKFAVVPPVHSPEGESTSVFGGGALGINAFSRQPQAAWKLIQFLLAPENLKKRALALGMLPPLKSLYDDPDLVASFPYLKDLKQVFFSARPRPITPLYSFISDNLRIHFSRALTRQESPEVALSRAEEEIAALLKRFGRPGGAP